MIKMARNFHDYFIILLTSVLSRNEIIDFYSKFLQLQFRLYLLNRITVSESITSCLKAIE